VREEGDKTYVSAIHRRRLGPTGRVDLFADRRVDLY
jgi:hypothetical protein